MRGRDEPDGCPGRVGDRTGEGEPEPGTVRALESGDERAHLGIRNAVEARPEVADALAVEAGHRMRGELRDDTALDVARWAEVKGDASLPKRLHELRIADGRDAMGHPLEAVAWVANLLNRRGRRLEGGMVVMTGSSITTKFPAPGDRVRFAIDGLGEIALEAAR